MLDCPLYKRFDIIFGTSTGAIIAALLALGFKIDDIHDLYKKHVPTVMSKRKPEEKSKALSTLSSEVFGDSAFTEVKTQIGIVATPLGHRTTDDLQGQRSPSVAGRYRKPDRAGSVLRAHFCGTVP